MAKKKTAKKKVAPKNKAAAAAKVEDLAAEILRQAGGSLEIGLLRELMKGRGKSENSINQFVREAIEEKDDYHPEAIGARTRLCLNEMVPVSAAASIAPPAVVDFRTQVWTAMHARLLLEPGHRKDQLKLQDDVAPKFGPRELEARNVVFATALGALNTPPIPPDNPFRADKEGTKIIVSL